MVLGSNPSAPNLPIPPWQRVLGPALLLLLTITLASSTWTRSGDPFLDSSKDLYIAQQMVNGRALYGELCYLFGPFAPCVLSIAFSVFGVSVNVERAVNLAIFLPVLAILYRMVVRISDRYAATVMGAIYLLLFAFGHLTPLRNYNILTPYTNSATYGFALGILLVAALFEHAQGKRICWPFLAGVACGMSFLTKPEIFLACGLTLAAGWAIVGYVRRDGLNKLLQSAGVMALGCMVGPVVILSILSMQSSWEAVWEGTTAGYRMAMDPPVRAMRFQLASAGLWAWRRSVSTGFAWLCVYGWVILPPLLLSLLPTRFRKWQPLIASVAAIGLFGAVWKLSDPDRWGEFFTGATYILAFAAIVLIVVLFRTEKTADARTIIASRLIFTVFALLMLSRMILNARIYQYGFVLAAAAMMVVGMALLSWIPRALDQRGRCGWILRGAATGILGGVVVAHVTVSLAVLNNQKIDIGWGYRVSGNTGMMLKDAITDLNSKASPGDTLASLPCAPWANFVSGLPNPTPYDLLDPLGFIRAGGEEKVFAAYQAHPPTWILLVHQDTSEYGAGLFGLHYAKEIGKWIDTNYELLTVYGAAPLKSRQFGVALLKRKAGQASP